MGSCDWIWGFWTIAGWFTAIIGEDDGFWACCW